MPTHSLPTPARGILRDGFQGHRTVNLEIPKETAGRQTGTAESGSAGLPVPRLGPALLRVLGGARGCGGPAAAEAWRMGEEGYGASPVPTPT